MPNPASSYSTAPRPLAMSLLRQYQSEGDAAPVHREENQTLVPQELLGQLGLGTADPEARDGQDAEDLFVRETPELFGECVSQFWNFTNVSVNRARN